MVLLLAVACSVTGQQTLSEEEAEEILNAHNYYRSLVDPIASDMLKLAWDVTMAYNAEFWADNCQYEYNEDRHDQSTKYDYIGQNILATDDTSVNYTILLGKWFQQRSSYNYYTGTCRDEDGEEREDLEGCEGYSQMVWASTTVVGCGVKRCAEMEGDWDEDGDEDEEDEDDNQNILFLVCNYGPGGNFEGEKPYQSGSEPCTSCPSDRLYCVNNLCSFESGAAVTAVSLLAVVLMVVAAMASH